MRHPDAAARLGALLASRARQPFVWGLRDCATFAFDAALEVSGKDAFADLRGTYSTGTGAMRQLKRLGGLHGVAAARLGPEIAPAERMDGDVALIDPSLCQGLTRVALGVAWRRAIVAQGAAGLVVVPPTAALRWWRAG